MFVDHVLIAEQGHFRSRNPSFFRQLAESWGKKRKKIKTKKKTEERGQKDRAKDKQR